jgi:putative oxidoreductase
MTTLTAPPASQTTPQAPLSTRDKVVRYTLGTTDDVAPLIARLALAGIFFPHGAQKVLGWFGGQGLGGTYAAFTQHMGIPGPFAALAIGTEFLAPIALLFGLVSRAAALGIAVIMTVAILTVHASNGFFMNWFGGQKGEGFEYHLLAIALAAIVVIKGAGRWSADQAIANKRTA